MECPHLIPTTCREEEYHLHTSRHGLQWPCCTKWSVHHQRNSLMVPAATSMSQSYSDIRNTDHHTGGDEIRQPALPLPSRVDGRLNAHARKRTSTDRAVVRGSEGSMVRCRSVKWEACDWRVCCTHVPRPQKQAWFVKVDGVDGSRRVR